MARLIDADQMALDESKAYMSAQGQAADDLIWLVNFGAHNKIQSLIAGAPTVDAVPVVRCRECAKRGTGECPMERDFPWVSSDSDGFCSFGERGDS